MDFKFSVVMAVYNVEPYLREAVDSVIGQTIGFDSIQLILVDDGSKDSSGAICDEYASRFPENIVVIHKENGGVSSARNAGLKCAQGRFVNFMDPDDKFDRDSFSAVYRFFCQHEHETDIVSVPIIRFEGAEGNHLLNYKFNKGNRIIDLTNEWTTIQLHVNSAFFTKNCLDGIEFDDRLHYTEDSNLIQRILIKKQSLGVVCEAAYYYRVREGGEQSALQISQQDFNWYLPRINYYFKDLIETCERETGLVPKFIQFAMMYDIQWILRLKALSPQVLSEEESEIYMNSISEILAKIDDEVILGQQNIYIETKLHALALKYGRPPELKARDGDLEIWCGGKAVYSISNRKVTVQFFTFEEEACTVEGVVSLFPFAGVEWSLSADLDGTPIPCETKRQERSIVSLDTEILDYYGFKIRVPLQSVKGKVRLRIGIKANDETVWLARYAYGPFSGLTEWYRSSCYVRSGWCVQNDGGVVFSRAGKHRGVLRELRYLWELATSRKHKARRAVLIRLACHFMKLWKRRPLWMISDRENKAGDNGEAFFRYMVERHPEIDVRFILRKDSGDYPALSRIGKVVPADSLRRKLLCLISDYVISSQAAMINIRPFGPKDVPYRDIMADYRFVFLQHGIIKDDLSKWLERDKKNIHGFITSAHAEYDSIVNGTYGYTEKRVWLTGLPRFDSLDVHEKPRQITVMPTWRKYLMGQMDPKTAVWSLRGDFFTSKYVSFFNGLLNSDRLIGAARQYGYSLAFFPHPLFQPHLDAFQQNDDVVFMGLETAYRDVYADSALVVTDYSSAVFDFAYLRRPVIYTQFDREEFFSGKHSYTEGYFDYERDGFGEVETDLDGTIDRIIEYMAGGCRMKDEYRARADRFFAYDDHNNCQRVYEKLIENS